MSELVEKDFELIKILTFLAMIAGIHATAMRAIQDRAPKCVIPTQWLIDPGELTELLGIEHEPESLDALEGARKHREFVKTLQYDIELLAGTKTAGGRTVLASAERLRDLLRDIAEERRCEVRKHVELETARHLAHGLTLDDIMGVLRKQYAQTPTQEVA